MVSLNREELLQELFSPDPEDPLRSLPAAIEAECGTRPHPTTCCRWHRQGIGGVRLETVVFGGRVKTTRRAVRHFINQRSQQRELQSV